MFDALKFAFEILIVGALALPWIAVLYRMFPASPSTATSSSSSSTSSSSTTTPSSSTSFTSSTTTTTSSSSPNGGWDLSFVPQDARNFVTVALVIGIGYLLGSGVSRFSADFFDDEIWRGLPTQHNIRDSIYYDEFCPDKVDQYWLPVDAKGFCPDLAELRDLKDLADFQHLPDSQDWNLKRLKRLKDLQVLKDRLSTYSGLRKLNKKKADDFDHRVEEVFRLEESELLLQGMDRIDRLKQYFDQITILRGAALNAFILFALGLFGLCGQLRTRWHGNFLVAWLSFLPSILVACWVIGSLILEHWLKGNIYQDPPLTEAILLLLSAVGVYAAWKPQRNVPYGKICLIAVVAMVISLGAWWWTETTYDHQVIHSIAELQQKKVLPIDLPPIPYW